MLTSVKHKLYLDVKKMLLLLHKNVWFNCESLWVFILWLLMPLGPSSAEGATLFVQ